MLKRVFTVLGLVAAIALVACEPTNGVAPGSFPQTGPMGISADGNLLYIAMADHNRVVAVDANTGSVISEVEVDEHPHRLTVMNDGRVAVTSRYAGTVSVLDANASAVQTTVEVGSDPFGIIEADGHLLVAVSGQQELAKIPVDDTGVVSERVLMDAPHPRGLARTASGKVYVSHFLDSKLSTVDVRQGLDTGDVQLKMAKNEHFAANQAEALTVDPQDSEVVVPHQQCNNDPEQFNGGNFSGQTVAYYSQGPTNHPAVIPAVTRVDVEADTHLNDGPGAWDANYPLGKNEEAGRAPGTINPLETNITDGVGINSPVAVALADGGKLELIVNRGSGNVYIRKANLADGERSLVGEVKAGVGASAIVLSPDGATAFVYNEFTYDVVAFAVPHVEQTTADSSLGQHQSVGEWNPLGSRAGLEIEEIARFHLVERMGQPLSEEVRRGRHLFHAVNEDLTVGGAISCASCHPGGMADGTSWEFVEGRRQTPALWGGLMDTMPLHWDNSFRDMNDLNSVTIQSRMGGNGLSTPDLDALSAFIDTIPAPAAPMNADEASITRGREIFFDEQTQCATCHSGAHFTDGNAHDVGTGIYSDDGRESQSRFSTPLLHGLAHTGPYLHDGRAKTLEDLIETYVAEDLMGHGSHLTTQDKADLAAFLKSL